MRQARINSTARTRSTSRGQERPEGETRFRGARSRAAGGAAAAAAPTRAPILDSSSSNRLTAKASFAAGAFVGVDSRFQRLAEYHRIADRRRNRSLRPDGAVISSSPIARRNEDRERRAGAHAVRGKLAAPRLKPFEGVVEQHRESHAEGQVGSHQIEADEKRSQSGALEGNQQRALRRPRQNDAVAAGRHAQRLLHVQIAEAQTGGDRVLRQASR